MMKRGTPPFFSFFGRIQKRCHASSKMMKRDTPAFVFGRTQKRCQPKKKSLRLQSDVRLAVYKIRLADSFLSTDRGRYLYWVDAALGTLNWAQLPEGAYMGPRLAAWISSNFATATYSETTNSLSVAYDGNRLILNDLELRQQFPDAADYPAAPPASPAKPFSVDHMLGPSFVSGGQQIFEFVRMMARNEVYLRCAQLANASRVLDNLGDDILSKITLKSGVGTIVETGSQGPGYAEAHALPPDRPGGQRRPASRVVFVLRVVS